MELIKPMTDTKAAFPHKHLTGIEPLSTADITAILDIAQDYVDMAAEEESPAPTLKGKVILNLFFENSTRTRTSFEIAAKRLGAEVVNWSVATSSMKKDETFDDTIATLNALGPDAVIIRHSEYGAPDYVAARVDCPVINAGDSHRAHPTQALLDALTIRQAKGALEGLTVAICGDLSHSRVAASNIHLLSKMGATIHLIAPPSLMVNPNKLPDGTIKMFDSMEDGLPGCDAVMMLRVQKERMEDSEIPDDTAYFHQYGLTQERLALAKPGAIVLHPGPINRGVEIADDVADDPVQSMILRQVANGVFVRMAVLDLLLRD